MDETPIALYFWQNGLVMAFDDEGRQMPAWQDHAAVIEAKLARLSPDARAMIEIRRNCRWDGGGPSIGQMGTVVSGPDR